MGNCLIDPSALVCHCIFGACALELYLLDALFLLCFLLLISTSMTRHLVHRFPSYNVGYAVLVVAVVFTVDVLVLLLCTSAQDPGIIPQNSHPPEEEIFYE
ncbi:hypothetical protein Drorol1_Dr00014529 [Drosera rotundifolia]